MTTAPTASADEAEPIDASVEQPTNVIRSSIEFLGSRGILISFGLVSNLLAARLLGPSGRGELAAALQVSYLISFIVVLGLDRAAAVVAPGRASNEVLSIGTRLMRNRSAALVAVGAALTVGGLATDADRIVSFAAFVTLMAVFSGCFRLVEAAFVNADKARWMLGFQAVNGGTTMLLVIGLALIANTNSLVWMGTYALSAGLVTAATLFWKGRSPHGREDPVVKQWTSTGLRLLPASLAGFATLRSDRLLLPLLADTEELGIYVVVATFVDLASVPFEAAANILLPRWRLAALNGTLSTKRPIAAIMAGAAVGAVVIYGIGALLVEPVFGSEYSPGVDVLPVLCVAAFLLSTGRIWQSRALALGLDRLVSLAETVGLVAGMLGYVILIPRYGGMGAAAGSAIGYGSSLLVVATGQALRRTSPETDDSLT